MSPYFLSVILGGGDSNVILIRNVALNHFRFYETPFPDSQNCVAFSYDSEKKYSEKKYSCYDDAFMDLTVKNLN